MNKLLELRKSKRLTQAELADICCVKQNTISNWENENTEIDNQCLQKLADFFNVSVDYLLGRTEPPLPAEAMPFNYNNMVRIPIVGEVHAGNGGYAQESIEGYQLVDINDLRGYPIAEFFFLRVTGDSMSPDLQEDDLILVHKQSSIDNGDIGVFLIDDEEPLIKKVHYKENYIELISFNPFYKPRVFLGHDVTRVYVVGKVKQSVRRW